MKCFLYNNCSHVNCDKPFCLRKKKMEELYNAALITDRQRRHVNITLDQDSELDQKDYEAFTSLAKISNQIVELISNEDRDFHLYLHSSISGNGKTSWALRIIEKYFDKIWIKSDTSCRALFISVPKFLIALKNRINGPDEYADYILDNVLNADIVIWDDIAAKTGSEYEINQLLNLINDRIDSGRTNIYTSNLNPTEMMSALGSRLTSRICNMSVDIELFGNDKRCWSMKKEEN